VADGGWGGINRAGVFEESCCKRKRRRLKGRIREKGKEPGGVGSRGGAQGNKESQETRLAKSCHRKGKSKGDQKKKGLKTAKKTMAQLLHGRSGRVVGLFNDGEEKNKRGREEKTQRAG